MSEQYMKYAEAAAYLGLPVNTLYAMVSRRTIPHVRISGRLVRFSKAALQEWLAGKMVEVRQ